MVVRYDLSLQERGEALAVVLVLGFEQLALGREGGLGGHDLRRLSVDRDDGGAAEADVVLQGHLGALDLALVRLAAQLPGQLRALRQAGGAERVALGDQAAARG